MDCFASLAMTWKLLLGASIAVRDAAILQPRSHTGTRNIFFTIVVDGMFTTFIARPFTNTSQVMRQTQALSCVMHAGNAS